MELRWGIWGLCFSCCFPSIVCPQQLWGPGAGLDGEAATHLVTNTISVLEQGQESCKEPDTRYLFLIGKTGLICLLINRKMCVGKEKESG